MAEYGGQLSLFQLVGKFSQRLVHGFHRVQLRNIRRQVPRAGLAHFHQVLDQLF